MRYQFIKLLINFTSSNNNILPGNELLFNSKSINYFLRIDFVRQITFVAHYRNAQCSYYS